MASLNNFPFMVKSLFPHIAPFMCARVCSMEEQEELRLRLLTIRIFDALTVTLVFKFSAFLFCA